MQSRRRQSLIARFRMWDVEGQSSSLAAVYVISLGIGYLAVRVGFEPTEPVKAQRFSRPPDSTTLAPHRGL